MINYRYRRINRFSHIVFILSFMVISASTGYETRFLSQTNNVNLNEEGGGHHGAEPGSEAFYTYLILSLVCVLGAGVCSGLTVGYLSINSMYLDMQIKNGSDEEKKIANSIKPVLDQHHLLLSTLLVANAGCMEALPVFLHQLVPAYLAIILSTSVVLLFGEIIPQAFCTGPNQLKIAYYAIPVIRTLEILLIIICYPIVKILDCVLGHGGKQRFPKKDIATLISLHGDAGQHQHQPRSSMNLKSGDQQGRRPSQQIVDQAQEHKQFGFKKDEITLLKSLLDLREELVVDSMIKYANCYKLSTQSIINRELIGQIQKAGFSQVPVFEGKNNQKIIGILKTRNILLAEEKHLNKPIGSRFPLIKDIIYVYEETTCLEMMNIFAEKKCNFAFVVKAKADSNIMQNLNHATRSLNSLVITRLQDETITGIVCLTDVFELILDAELKDAEQHIFSGNQAKKVNKADYSSVVEMKEIKNTAKAEQHIFNSDEGRQHLLKD